MRSWEHLETQLTFGEPETFAERECQGRKHFLLFPSETIGGSLQYPRQEEKLAQDRPPVWNSGECWFLIWGFVAVGGRVGLDQQPLTATTTSTQPASHDNIRGAQYFQ
jgi:hypothetical protein